MALDITLLPGEIAVIPSTQTAGPTESDWVAAEWVRAAPAQQLVSNNRLTTDYWFCKVNGSVFDTELGLLESDFAWLQVMVGPAGAGIPIPAEATKVDVWSRVQATPEVPVQKHGSVTITP